MNEKDLKRASELVRRYGVKSVMYGGPGTGKTPLVDTAPNPLMLVVEPGMMTMKNSNIPCFEANTSAKINEFFTWFFQSNESKKFDTLAIDSISQLCEVILTEELKTAKDPRKAYGNLSRQVMAIADSLFYLENKHIYLIAKCATFDENGTSTKKPYFPGQDLNVKIPHLFDEVWYIGKTNIPGIAQPTVAIRTVETYGILARDRSKNLDELENPWQGLASLFAKCMR
jgi:hypothetical protein